MLPPGGEAPVREAAADGVRLRTSDDGPTTSNPRGAERVPSGYRAGVEPGRDRVGAAWAPSGPSGAAE